MHGSNADSPDDALTLDPPGSIAVVGAGPLGIEAALYGRFLGYDVTLIEAEAVGQSMRHEQESPLPMLPDRCLSTLAVSALKAQQRDWARQSDDRPQGLPTTCGQWIEDALIPLTESDLLKGRLRNPVRVTDIVQLPIEPDEPGEDTSEIPPDFRLTLVEKDGPTVFLDVEAVILSVGSTCEIQLGFEPPVPYFYRIAAMPTGDAERDLANGRREIVAIFAELAGRADLDLYRPTRM